MNGQKTGAAEGKKPKAWAWQDIVIAIVAVACILFSTVIVAGGWIPLQPPRPHDTAAAEPTCIMQ